MNYESNKLTTVMHNESLRLDFVVHLKRFLLEHSLGESQMKPKSSILSIVQWDAVPHDPLSFAVKRNDE